MAPPLPILRASGASPDVSAPVLEAILKVQTYALEKLSTAATFRAMRTIESNLVDAYAEAADMLHGVARTGVETAMRRATIQWHVLTAHIAILKEDPDDAVQLPFPLAQYFARGEAHVCMRCLLDRPGTLGFLERTDPHPYTYVCAGCHDEVIADFPPDVLVQMESWTLDDRDARVIEKALGRPSKLKARKEVLSRLSGLEPEPERRAVEARIPSGVEAVLQIPAVENPPTIVTQGQAGELERRYADILLDFHSPRHHW